MKKLFVYGILQGEPGAVPASIRGDLYDLRAFPAAVNCGSHIAGEIHGELIEVDAKALARFDRIEGVPTLYDRVKVTASIGTEEVECWVYEFQGDLTDSKILLEGRWESPYIYSNN